MKSKTDHLILPGCQNTQKVTWSLESALGRRRREGKKGGIKEEYKILKSDYSLKADLSFK